MTFDLESSHFLQDLDQEPLPPYTPKAADLLTFSSLSVPKMTNFYTAVSNYFHFGLILVCLIASLASMPLIDLCNGNGAFVGTFALTTGVGLVFNQYWKVSFLYQDENDPQVPHS
jgi:uncharacterized membrane protein